MRNQSRQWPSLDGLSKEANTLFTERNAKPNKKGAMSHYAVAVFRENPKQSIADLLAPYDEGIQVEPYVQNTKAELIWQERDCVWMTFKGSYAEWCKNPKKYESKCFNDEHIDFLKSIPERLKWTDAQYYQEATKRFKDSLNDEGDLLTTYNPDSKWDWYEIGGRWKNLLILKDKTVCDAAYVPDIDFQAMQKRNKAELRPYERAMTNSIFKAEYMRRKFQNEADFIKLNITFSTYAVIIPNGEWHALGNVGWWGFSAETPAKEREWMFSYNKRFIKPAIEKGWYLTIVDCHI